MFVGLRLSVFVGVLLSVFVGVLLSVFVGVLLSVAVSLAVPGFLLFLGLDFCASSCYTVSIVSLVVSWFVLLFLLLVLVLLFPSLALFLVWACVPCVVLCGRFRAGCVFVPLLPLLWLVPLLLVRLLSFLVLVRSA